MAKLMVKEPPLPQELAERLGARREDLLEFLGAYAADSGKLLYELEWLAPAEVKRLHRRLRWRSWCALGEMLLGTLVLFAFFVLLARLVADLLGL